VSVCARCVINGPHGFVHRTETTETTESTPSDLPAVHLTDPSIDCSSICVLLARLSCHLTPSPVPCSSLTKKNLPPPAPVSGALCIKRDGFPGYVSVLCTKRHSFLSFPYVCPEPVLVKRCILYITPDKWLKKRRFSHLSAPTPSPLTGAPLRARPACSNLQCPSPVDTT
jgi:hypothetical protein